MKEGAEGEVVSSEGREDLGGWRKSSDLELWERRRGGDNVLQVSDEVESSRVCREGKVKRKLESGRKNRWRP